MSTQSPKESTAAPTAPYSLSPAHRRVFIGLMLGMLVASISQTIVGPAMPRIVAELGGMDHYSWVATAALLVSAITVPIVGKLSDLYGRRSFYLAGLIVFVVGSLISGIAPNFWVLVAGRAVQGLGMGTLMPLSQTIIGDIIPPRQRGKYQGYMGAVFGLTSVAGPLAGGYITDHFGWRWLFFASMPVGLATTAVIARFLHLEHERRDAKIDVAGIMTLSLGLIAGLLATSWGGTTYAWGSPMILGLYAGALVMLVAFVLIERRAEEPVLPLRLFANSVFTWSNIGAFGVAMVMFGAIIYIPIYAQGVLGVNATDSGLILMPLMLGLITFGILSGLFITRTGRYKEPMLLGVLIMAAGLWLLVRLGAASSMTQLTVAMSVLGIGLGMVMQQYTLVVQNAVTRRDLGVATASIQFFRNVGSTVGIAIFGTVMTAGLGAAIASHLPEGMAADLPSGSASVGSVLDPASVSGLPPEVAEAVRQGLADRLHDVFLLALPVLVLVFLATLAIKALPLRDTVHDSEGAQREFLDSMSQSSPDANVLVPGLSGGDLGARTRERVLGGQFELLARQAATGERPLLRRGVSELGGGSLEAGVTLLQRTAVMLLADDLETEVSAERYACEVAVQAERSGGLLSEQLRQDMAVAVAPVTRDQVLSTVEPTVAERHQAVPVSGLFRAANDLGAALLVDIAAAQRATSDAEVDVAIAQHTGTDRQGHPLPSGPVAP